MWWVGGVERAGDAEYRIGGGGGGVSWVRFWMVQGGRSQMRWDGGGRSLRVGSGPVFAGARRGWWDGVDTC